MLVVLQQLENNLLVPKIMERAVALHPLAVVLTLLVGGGSWASVARWWPCRSLRPLRPRWARYV